MTEVDRLPCRKCRQPVALDEPDCPHCGASLLVDVVVHGGIRDTRLRYQISKSLEPLPGAPPLPTIQRGLASATPALRGVTRAFAHETLPILGQNGVRSGIENHSPERRGGVPSLRWLLGAAGAAALLAVFYVGWLQVVRWIEPAKVRIIGSAPTERSGGASRSTGGPLAAPTAAPARSARELAKSGLAATVSLRCSNSVGSGFFVRSDLVLTNAHVLCGSGDSVAVATADGRTFTGTVVRRAAGIDLALVRVVGANASPLPLGDVGDLAVGDRVVMVGSPLGLDFTVHEGSISSLGRSSERTAYIQLDAKVNPGNSGGPIIDEQGRAVGVVSIKITGEGVDGIGLALPINYAYSGALGFVPPPSPAAAASAAFASMLARAQSGGGELQQAAEPGPAVPAGTPRSEDRPLLVAARIDEYRNLVVRVVRITDQEPRFEELTVKLWRGLEAFCTMRGDIRTWKKADAQLAASGMDARLATALRQVANGRTMFVGESMLRWDLCDYRNFGAGMEMELEGAHPMASRIRVY